MANSRDQAHENTDLLCLEQLTKMANCRDQAHENGKLSGPGSRKWQILGTRLTKALLDGFVIDCPVLFWIVIQRLLSDIKIVFTIKSVNEKRLVKPSLPPDTIENFEHWEGISNRKNWTRALFFNFKFLSISWAKACDEFAAFSFLDRLLVKLCN